MLLLILFSFVVASESVSQVTIDRASIQLVLIQATFYPSVESSTWEKVYAEVPDVKIWAVQIQLRLSLENRTPYNRKNKNLIKVNRLRRLGGVTL